MPSDPLREAALLAEADQIMAAQRDMEDKIIDLASVLHQGGLSKDEITARLGLDMIHADTQRDRLAITVAGLAARLAQLTCQGCRHV